MPVRDIVILRNYRQLFTWRENLRWDTGGVCCLKVHTENLGVARKCFTLLVKTFNIKTDVVVRRNTGKDNYSYYIYAKGEELLAIRDTIVQAVCCKGHI